MRYLIISDIHANLVALETVLAAAATTHKFDRVIVLGDLVGYGGQPNEVVDRVRQLDPAAIIRGNHDKAAAGLDDAEGFNYVARTAARWTFDALTPANREYLAALPVGPLLVNDVIEICHGMPADEDAYVVSELDAFRALKQTRRPVCFFGHTHIPVAYRMTEDAFEVVAPPGDAERSFVVEAADKYLINPGSVGQPRDGDRRAAFAIFDEETREMTLVRVEYAVEEAQERITAAGLPDALARRLAIGR